MSEDGPYTVPVSQRLEPDFYLTNIEWHPCHDGYDFACYETGVRHVENGEVTHDSFRLIEHGWRDFDRANEIILKGLRKGWGPCRIMALMERVKPKPPKAKIL